MEFQNSPPRAANALSPASAAREPKLHLPSTTDPPGPNNPPRQLVWLVCLNRRIHAIPHCEAKQI